MDPLQFVEIKETFWTMSSKNIFCSVQLKKHFLDASYPLKFSWTVRRARKFVNYRTSSLLFSWLIEYCITEDYREEYKLGMWMKKLSFFLLFLSQNISDWCDAIWGINIKLSEITWNIQRKKKICCYNEIF